jgi:hypothetical protein
LNKGEWDLGLRGIFDDGSGTAFVRGDRMIVEKVLGRKMDDLANEVKENLDPDSVIRDLHEKLVGRPATLTADPGLDDYGLAIYLNDLEMGWDIPQFEREILSMMEVMG